MTITKLFNKHGIKRIRVWTTEHHLTTFCSEDACYHPLMIEGDDAAFLEKRGVDFLRSNTVTEKTIFDFDRSRGVLYLKDGKMRYCGDVMSATAGEWIPFHATWAEDMKPTATT